MTSVGVRELKNSLSRYLASVKKGEVILITERGKEIARLIGNTLSPQERLLKTLQPLAVEGLLQLPRHPRRKKVSKPVKLSGQPLSKMIQEDRR